MTLLNLKSDIIEHLTLLNVTDEAYVEYIIQLFEDSSMDETEKIEVISELLEESTDLNQHVWISSIMESIKTNALEAQRMNHEARERDAQITSISIEPESVIFDVKARHTKVSKTNEEMIARKQLISQYGYFSEDEIQNSNSSDIIDLRGVNAGVIKDGENLKKAEHKLKHDNEVKMNKEMIVKQKLEKLNKRKGPPKREKVRG